MSQLHQTISNAVSLVFTAVTGVMLGINLGNYVNDSNDQKYTNSFIFTLMSMALCMLKFVIHLMIAIPDGWTYDIGSNLRLGAGSVLLAFNGILLGTHYKDEYRDSVMIIFFLFVGDRLLNLFLTYESLADSFKALRDEDFYNRKSAIAIAMLLAGSVTISALDFGISDHYDDDQGEWLVALIGIIVAGVHLLLMLAVLMDLRVLGPNLGFDIEAYNRLPAVRSLATGAHVALLAIHVGHLSAGSHENMAMLIALQLLVVVDVYGRNDGKTVL